MKFKIALITLFFSFTLHVNAQPKTGVSLDKKNFVSTSAFMLMNAFLPDEPPRFIQLNYGRRLSSKDAIIIEALTWQYHAPLGIPYGKEGDKFPGIVRDYGIGIAYQRFVWKKFYTAIHATPFLQQYLTPEKKKIQSGFQLFTTLRFGYHFRLFKEKIFIEPSVAFTAWPINTNLPDEFAKMEDKWPGYFLFEPGLHLGFNF